MHHSQRCMLLCSLKGFIYMLLSYLFIHNIMYYILLIQNDVIGLLACLLCDGHCGRRGMVNKGHCDAVIFQL